MERRRSSGEHDEARKRSVAVCTEAETPSSTWSVSHFSLCALRKLHI